MAYNKEISNRMKQIKELQQKIENVQQKNAEIEIYGLTSLEEKLVREDNLGFQYA